MREGRRRPSLLPPTGTILTLTTRRNEGGAPAPLVADGDKVGFEAEASPQ